MPVTRKRKIEVARLAGFGLVLAGLFALFLAVVNSQDAGAVKPSPRVNVLHCGYTVDTTGDGIGDAVQYGACQTTTSIETQGSTTTSKPNQCGCTTTTYVTTTTKHRCTCSTTTTEATTTTTGETTTSTSSPATSTSTAGSLPVESSTTSTPTENSTTTLGRQGGPISTVTTGGQGGSPTGGSAPVTQAEAVSGQLPFTGSSSFPLAGFGLLMVASGLALALRRRRLAR